MSPSDAEDAAAITGPVPIPIVTLRDRDAIASEPAPYAVSDSGYLAEARRVAAGWARGRSLGPGSAYGIAAAFGLCAAAWFTAGTRTDSIRGVAALCVAFLAWLAGRGLARLPQAPQAEGLHRPPAVRPVRVPGGPLAAGAGSADAVAAALPGSTRPGAAGTGGRTSPAEVAWLAAVCWWVPECVVYACLAIGATADGWVRMWPIAMAVICLVGVRDIMTACFRPADGPVPGPDRARWVLGSALRLPAGLRVVLIGVIVPVSGPRAAMLAVLICTGFAVLFGIAGYGRAAAARPADVLRLRDDGVLARQAGRIVRGNLLPLPPAALGFAAVITLAVLGMRNLSGVLVLGPALVMLLAAPGSSSDHTGRLDWLVPILLLGAQLVYIVALGVPWPITFALGAAVLLRYVDLAWPASPVLRVRPDQLGWQGPQGSVGRPRGTFAEHESWLGWEGRMIFLGLAAAAGLATFAYLALTAYLGVLVGAKILTKALREDGST